VCYSGRKTGDGGSSSDKPQKRKRDTDSNGEPIEPIVEKVNIL